MMNQEGFYPEAVFLNGGIVTLDESNTWAEAVATFEDKIVAVGTNSQIQGMAGSGTRIVDLAGKTMLPGLIEPHNHFIIYSHQMFEVNLSSPPVGRIRDIADLKEALRERADCTPKGGWVQGFGYDDTMLAEKRHPTRHDLDEVSTEHPICLTHLSMHIGVANTMALRLAGITRETPQPEGGVIRREDNTLEPDGVLEEMAQVNVIRVRPKPGLEDRLQTMAATARHYLRTGVTSCYDAAVGFMGTQDVQDYQKAVAKGLVPIRITMMMNPEMLIGAQGERVSFLTGFGNERLKIGPVKLLADGSIQAYTGWLSRPYHVPFRGDANYCGYPDIPPEKLNAQVRLAHEAGFQIAIHATGDAAIDAIIEAYRRAQEAYPRPDARHRIEHCQMAREDQLDAMAELGISPSFFVSHTWYWANRHKTIFLGPERVERISPLKSALKRGIRFSIHSDCPVTPVSPLFCVFAAVNRISSSGEVIGAEYRLTVEEALRAVTIDAAWQDFEEKKKGSIEVGKLADFTILADDPLKIDPMKIRDIRVEEVFIGGASVYQAE